MLKSSQSAVLSLSTGYSWLIQLWHTHTGFNTLYWFFCHWGYWTRSSKVLCWTSDPYGTFIRGTISLYMCKERGKEIILVDYLLQLQISLYMFKTNIFLYMYIIFDIYVYEQILVCMFRFWRRKWQLSPVHFPGKCNGQKSLPGYSPWGSQCCTQLSNQTTLEIYIFQCIWRRKEGDNPCGLSITDFCV